MRHSLLYYTVVLIFFAGCAASSPFHPDQQKNIAEPPVEKPIYSVFLIGDTGNAAIDLPNPPLDILQEQINKSGHQSTVVFLGDNLYPDGLPAEGSPDRRDAEEKLIAQLKTVEDYPGRVVFIPGNHDWASSGRSGLEAVLRMEQFIESYLNRGNTFLPDSGFPGPVDIKLMDKDEDPLLTRDIHLVVLDTQWWLHTYDKSFGENGQYTLHDNGDFLNELTNIMRNRQNDHLVVAGHHPLFANGNHGGNFPLKTHLLPPVFGTGYVLYRKFFGLSQDISHYRYRSLKRELLSAFDEAESLVYAAGHEHILQHNIKEGRRRNQHYVVSGSGSKTDYVIKGKGAEFVSGERGFTVINYYSDRSSWMEFWNEKGDRIYSAQLLAPDDNPFLKESAGQKILAPPDFSDSTITTAANKKYDQVGSVHRILLGSHNRRFWSIPVEVPLFDISQSRGKLEVVKMGGTGQSTNLRLKDSEGHTYVLRSIDKEAGRIWDPTLRKTLAEDLAQDQFSIINPHGAFMMPPLAEAAGVYHTRPELYAVPDDPRLGRFSEQLHGQLVLFEERPDGDMSHSPHLSGSSEVISTRDMLRKTDSDIDHRVDQKMMLRNRLLDILVSDWDRHEDQWRWASFEPPDGKGRIYQPIPRDRDMAFLRMNGLIPTLGKFSFFSHYQDFRSNYGNLKELTSNSLPLTRRFTNQLTRNDWIAAADSIKVSITDDIIDNAVSMMPQPVARAEGDEIKSILKIRRDKLPEAARQYYELITGVVDVVGSHKREKFTVDATRPDSVFVQVHKVKKDGEVESRYYNRIFYPWETKEVRLFGLGGDDTFEIEGPVSGAIKIRIIGGPGSDEFLADTAAISRKLLIYDTNKGSRFSNIKNRNLQLSDSPEINKYDPNSFYYNKIRPLLFFGSNRDDGIFLGGGVGFTQHGFRKKPAAADHRIRGNFAAKTQAFNMKYDGFFANVTGGWDAWVKADILLPNNIRNFYGLGNETDDENIIVDFYRARLQQYRIRTMWGKETGTGIFFGAGPHYQITKVSEDQGKFITQPQAGISENTFDDQWFAGLHTIVEMQSVDNPVNIRQGFRWNNEAIFNVGLRNTSNAYSVLSTNLSLYISPVIEPQLTFATRFGVQHNIGDFPFYEANTLGGKHSLRGLLSNRYAGRTSFYNNVEIRTKLLEFQNYLLGGDIGVTAFFDHGRIWTDGENSNRWHYGAGGGIWISVFNRSVMHGSIGYSEGSYNLLVGAGFFF